MAVARVRTPGLHSVTRRKGIYRLLPENPVWHVRMTDFGTYVVSDEAGLDPLKSPDPLARMRNIHLAASAPQLREALFLTLQRFEVINNGRHNDEQVCRIAWNTIYESRPTVAEELKVGEHDSQVEIDLEEAA